MSFCTSPKTNYRNCDKKSLISCILDWDKLNCDKKYSE